MQFVIYLFLKITQIQGNFTDDFTKKEVLGIGLAVYLLKFSLEN